MVPFITSVLLHEFWPFECWTFWRLDFNSIQMVGICVLCPMYQTNRSNTRLVHKKARWHPFVWYSKGVQIPDYLASNLFWKFEYPTSSVFRSPLNTFAHLKHSTFAGCSGALGATTLRSQWHWGPHSITVALWNLNILNPDILKVWFQMVRFTNGALDIVPTIQNWNFHNPDIFFQIYNVFL